MGAPECFTGRASAAGLYWALTHASGSGSEAIQRLKNEDAMTADFITALQREVENAQDLLGAGTTVAIGHIFQHLRPALKEVSVGADLLMVVSGDGLVPRGGVRLLWIQFKQAEAGSPIGLNVYRKPNAAGRTQLEALRAVHSTTVGSFGVYALASDAYTFFAATIVNKLGHVVPSVASTCKINLGEEGVRFQEVVLALASDTNCGEFTTSTEVVQFVDALAAERSIIPLTVLGVSSGRELVSGRDLVQLIKASWEERLREHRQRLRNDNPLQIERDDGSSMDR